VSLATGGKPIQLNVSPASSSSSTPGQMSAHALGRMMTTSNATFNQLKTVEKEIRASFGRKALESNAHSKIVEMTHSVDEGRNLPNYNFLYQFTIQPICF
jgi:hypothetical protein